MARTLSLNAVPKKYEEAFKRQAVEMVLRRGKTVKQTADDLGVSQSSIYQWKKKFGGRMMMQMVGAFAEFGRVMLRERTKVGLDAARKIQDRSIRGAETPAKAANS